MSPTFPNQPVYTPLMRRKGADEEKGWQGGKGVCVCGKEVEVEGEKVVCVVVWRGGG